METFDRIGPSPFTPDGHTKGTDICFAGNSQLRIYAGSPYNNFRLRFSNRDGEGWWVGPASLDQLIVELLYVRKDMQRLKDGIDLDIEVGRVDAEAWEHPEDDEEEEADEAMRLASL